MMSATADRELKLEAESGFAMPEFEGAVPTSRVFTSIYHDTGDLRLARAGITLRRKLDERSDTWQLRFPRGKRRVSVDLPGSETAPAEVLDALLVHTRDLPVNAVATVRTTRASVTVTDGEQPLAEITSDTLEVLEGDVVTVTTSALEIELIEGDSDTLDDLAARLRSAGARDSDGRSKVERALGVTFAEPDAEIEDPDSPPERLRAVVAAQYRAIILNDPGTRLGTELEHLHQHRVAVRRLRSVLRAAAPMLDPTWTRDIRGELGWAGAALGPVRDLDVMLEHLRGEIATLPGGDDHPGVAPLITELEAEHAEARETMLDALRSQRYLDLIDRLRDAATVLPVVKPEISLTRLARKEFRKVRKTMEALGPLPTDDRLHEARIKVKRLRYTSELAAPFGGEELEDVVTETRAVQELLGDHQDAHVAEERISTLLGPEPSEDSQLAAARLIERERIRRRAIRREVPAAWDALRTAGERAFE
jgi:CHAD domain-containing protein